MGIEMEPSKYVHKQIGSPDSMGLRFIILNLLFTLYLLFFAYVYQFRPMKYANSAYVFMIPADEKCQ